MIDVTFVARNDKFKIVSAKCIIDSSGSDAIFQSSSFYVITCNRVVLKI